MTTSDYEPTQDLIDRSSLGTPVAKALRALTPSTTVERILARSRALLSEAEPQQTVEVEMVVGFNDRSLLSTAMSPTPAPATSTRVATDLGSCPINPRLAQRAFRDGDAATYRAVLAEEEPQQMVVGLNDRSLLSTATSSTPAPATSTTVATEPSEFAASDLGSCPINPRLAQRAFRDGDAVAYNELLRILEPRLRRHALRLLGPDRRSDVDDLLQETFERLHRATAVLDDNRPVEAWAFVIMRNLCVDWYRAASRRPRAAPMLAQDIEVGQPRAVGGKDDGIEDRALLLDLQNALMQLPLDRRRLIELVYFKGIPLTEAASRLKMTYGTARYQLTVALGQLRAALGLQEDLHQKNMH